MPWSLVNAEGVDQKVKENFKESIKKLEKLGFKIKDISIKNIDLALATYYIIMPAEASTNLARFDGVRYGLHKDGKNLLEDYKLTKGVGFGKEVRRRILLGAYVLSAGYYDAYYGKAQIARNELKKEFAKAFAEVDIDCYSNGAICRLENRGKDKSTSELSGGYFYNYREHCRCAGYFNSFRFFGNRKEENCLSVFNLWLRIFGKICFLKLERNSRGCDIIYLCNQPVKIHLFKILF